MCRWLVFVCAGVLLAAGCTQTAAPPTCFADSPERTTHEYRSIEGVDTDLLTLDIYGSATADACPVVMWVHGGSWQAGDKRTTATQVKADHFTADGYVFVSVNYRLAAENNAVRWPDFGDDVAAAAVWVADNAADIGVDPERLMLMGHSSGAHLVSIAGVSPTLLKRAGGSPSDLSCVISLDSVTHDLNDDPPWESDIISLAFPDEASRIDGSPTLQVREAEDVSSGPTFLIVTRGRNERLQSSADLASAISEGGGEAQVVDVSPYDHGEVSTQLGVDGEEVVTPVVDEFLANCAGES